MELAVNQTLEFLPEPTEVAHVTNHGLLNSKYQTVVKRNFSKTTETSIFSIRQHVKFSQFHLVNHTSVILKLSVFAIVLIALF